MWHLATQIDTGISQHTHTWLHSGSKKAHTLHMYSDTAASRQRRLQRSSWWGASWQRWRPPTRQRGTWGSAHHHPWRWPWHWWSRHAGTTWHWWWCTKPTRAQRGLQHRWSWRCSWRLQHRWPWRAARCTKRRRLQHRRRRQDGRSWRTSRHHAAALRCRRRRWRQHRRPRRPTSARR